MSWHLDWIKGLESYQVDSIFGAAATGSEAEIRKARRGRCKPSGLSFQVCQATKNTGQGLCPGSMRGPHRNTPTLKILQSVNFVAKVIPCSSKHPLCRVLWCSKAKREAQTAADGLESSRRELVIARLGFIASQSPPGPTLWFNLQGRTHAYGPQELPVLCMRTGGLKVN